MSNKLIKPVIRHPQPLAHLNIASDSTGAVDVQGVFVGGFDRSIPAHAFAEQLLLLADSLGVREPVKKDPMSELELIPNGQVFS